MRALTKENIKVGLIIKSIDNPEWDSYVILNKYDDRIWEMRSSRGSRTLMECELNFWHIVK